MTNDYRAGLERAAKEIREVRFSIPQNGTQYDKGQRRACQRALSAIQSLLDKGEADNG